MEIESNSEIIPSPEVDAFRESMKQLLDMILAFFEEQQKLVVQGI